VQRPEVSVCARDNENNLTIFPLEQRVRRFQKQISFFFPIQTSGSLARDIVINHHHPHCAQARRYTHTRLWAGERNKETKQSLIGTAE